MDIFKKLISVRLKKYIGFGLHVLGILFAVIVLTSRVGTSDVHVFQIVSLLDWDKPFISILCIGILGLCFMAIVFGIAGAVASLTSKKFSFNAFVINFIMLILAVFINSSLQQIIGGGSKVALILAIVTELIGCIYYVLCKIFSDEPDTTSSEMILDPTVNIGRFKIITAAISTLSMIFLLLDFFVPFLKYTYLDTYLGIGQSFSLIPIKPVDAQISSLVNGAVYVRLIVFSLLFVAYSVSFANYLSAISIYKQNHDNFAAKAKKVIYGNAIISAVYFLGSTVYCFIRNAKDDSYSTMTGIPLVLTLITAIVFSVVSGYYSDKINIVGKDKKINFRKIELLIYGIVIGGISIASLMVDIISVRFNIEGADPYTVKINGLKLISTYNELGTGFQLMAFFVFVFLVISVTMTVLMIISLISHSRFFYKISAFSIVANSLIAFAVGAMGKYYQIATKVNENVILSLISERFNLGVGGLELSYRVRSQSFGFFIAAMVVLAITLLRVPYTKGLEAQEESGNRQNRKNATGEVASAITARLAQSDASDTDFDACPAFTELDGRAGEYALELNRRYKSKLESPSLPSLVQFIVEYARSSRLHLSYSVDDIAAFVAGLGATRLTILQGMSGTGKTSLPKIFLEAIMGNCEIVEVESSWRDKNELLGYYNEFSKTYTPKKFTQALYKARLNPDVVVFIVLDEMNLSRIEYYFSDFLSIMENEEDKRNIKLLNVKLYNTVDGEKCSYSALCEGHTLKIPGNVWFVGTANRDESTFEISDKVYDRAHTMNFNKRAKKPAVYSNQPLDAKFLPCKELIAMLENAKNSFDFDIEKVPVIKEVEDILAEYNISFGNRVARQMEDFVKIYCACFYDGERMQSEAVEKILLSKVVSKLEYKNVDNKDELAVEFERLGLYRCAEFVSKLNEE